MALVYALELAAPQRELVFLARVERTASRARSAAFRMMSDTLETLRAQGITDIQVQDEALPRGAAALPPAPQRRFTIKASIHRLGNERFTVEVVAIPEPGESDQVRRAASATCRWLKEVRREQARLVIAMANAIRAEGNEVIAVEVG